MLIVALSLEGLQETSLAALELPSWVPLREVELRQDAVEPELGVEAAEREQRPLQGLFVKGSQNKVFMSSTFRGRFNMLYCLLFCGVFFFFFFGWVFSSGFFFGVVCFVLFFRQDIRS